MPRRNRFFWVGGLVVGASLAVGCVTRGTHEEILAQRDALDGTRAKLERRVELLERSNRSLDAERSRLLDELEGFRQDNEALSGDVKKLSKAERVLAAHLREREAELEKLAELKNTYESLVEDLESQVSAGQIQIEQLRDGMRLNLSQAILFPSGSAQLNAEGQSVIKTVSNRLKDLSHGVEVRGHTDNVPVRRGGSFPSNWELAAARASSVVRLLEGEGVSPDRLSAVSMGQHDPVASNSSRDGRAKNRRIEIRLSPKEAPLSPVEAKGTAPGA